MYRQVPIVAEPPRTARAQTTVAHQLRSGTRAASNAARRSSGPILQIMSGTMRKTNGVASFASFLCARHAPSNDLRMKALPGSCILIDATSAWRGCRGSINADAAKRNSWKLHLMLFRCSVTKVMAEACCVRFAKERATPFAITLHIDAHAVMENMAGATSTSTMSIIPRKNERAHYNASPVEKQSCLLAAGACLQS